MKKKMIAAFLCLCLLCTLAAPAYAAVPADELQFAVASDLHVNLPKAEKIATGTDPVYCDANTSGKLTDESGFLLDELLKQCAEDEAIRFVLLSGDLADHGATTPAEHALIIGKLKAFEETTGKSVFVINGNHDFSVDGATTPEQFRELYADFGYNEALTTLAGTCSYTADLGSSYRLIALDSFDTADPKMDGLSQERVQWVTAAAEEAKRDGREPILMMHHTLLSHMPLMRIIAPAMHGASAGQIVSALTGQDAPKYHTAAAEAFANAGIRIVLSGHEHMSDATSYTSLTGNLIYDFTTTSLSMYPLQYRVFSLTNEEIVYEARTVDTLDFPALTAGIAGYADRQLAAMQSGMNAYAKGFLKLGMERRLTGILSAERLGFSPSDTGYALVNDAVQAVSQVFSMPLYGENSAASLAADFEIDIPASSYQNGWDLVTELIASFYAGTENAGPESPEVKILLELVALALRKTGTAVSDEAYLAAADTIFTSLGLSEENAHLSGMSEFAFGSITPVEYLAVALASPVIYGFTYDDDGIDDNNGALPGAGTVTPEGNARNAVTNLTTLIEKIVAYFRLIIGAFQRIGSYT